MNERRRSEAFELYKELVRAGYAAAHVSVAHEAPPGFVVGLSAMAADLVDFDALAAIAFDAVDSFDHVAGTDDIGAPEGDPETFAEQPPPLVACAECGLDFPADFERCPHCGALKAL